MNTKPKIERFAKKKAKSKGPPAKAKKPLLPVSFISYGVVRYDKLEAYAKLVYKLDYSFGETEDCDTDSCFSKRFNITGIIEPYQIEDSQKIFSGTSCNSTRLLLNCLAAEGYIIKGQYLVTT